MNKLIKIMNKIIKEETGTLLIPLNTTLNLIIGKKLDFGKLVGYWYIEIEVYENNTYQNLSDMNIFASLDELLVDMNNGVQYLILGKTEEPTKFTLLDSDKILDKYNK